MTKYMLAEQVLLLLKGGDVSAATSVEIPDAVALIEQLLNRKLKVEYFSETLGTGEVIPDGLALATYDELVVEAYKNVSRVLLPALPAKGLPKGMGVFQVMPYDNPACQFIPLQPGQWTLVREEELFSDLLGQVGYEVYGRDVLFTGNLLTLAAPITKVMIRMFIQDLSRLGDFDLLPAPADVLADVVTEAYQLLSGQHSPDKLVDNTAENQRQIKGGN